MVNPARAVKFQKVIDTLYRDKILVKPPVLSPKTMKEKDTPANGEHKQDKNEEGGSWWKVV